MVCHLHIFLCPYSGAGVDALEVGCTHRFIQEFAFAGATAVVFGVAITAVPAVGAAVPRLGEPVQVLHGLANQEWHAGGAVAKRGMVVKIPSQVLTFGAATAEPAGLS